MNKLRVIYFFAIILVASACELPEGRGSWLPPENHIADKQLGRQIYSDYCMHCHGRSATGSQRGPALVHKVYAPSHHADLSFYMAVKNGVKAHHWRFGNMPPVSAVSPDQTAHVIAYVRDLQRKAGIF